jgi:hypothetical protein
VLVCGTGNGDIVLFNVVRMDASRTPDTKPTPRPFVIRAVPDEMERRRRSALSVLDQ